MSSPVIIDPIATTETGILRPLYRRALMAQLGPFVTLTTTAVSTHGEAKRHVIVSSLRDDTLGRERLKGRYLYAPYVTAGDTLGFQTRIIDTGYHGAGGVLEIASPFDSALPVGTVVEISTGLPCEQFLDIKGGNQFVNEALTRCTVESRTTLTGNGTREYDLLAYEGFIDQSARVDAIYDAWGTVSTDPLEWVPYPIRIDDAGGSRTLVTPRAYSTSETFDVRVLRAGHTLIHDGISWQASTVGLTSDTEAAAAPIPWVVAIGMVKALQAMTEMVEQDEALSEAARVRQLTTLMNRRRQWARAANVIITTQFPEPIITPSGFAASAQIVGDRLGRLTTTLPVAP